MLRIQKVIEGQLSQHLLTRLSKQCPGFLLPGLAKTAVDEELIRHCCVELRTRIRRDLLAVQLRLGHIHAENERIATELAHRRPVGELAIDSIRLRESIVGKRPARQELVNVSW